MAPERRPEPAPQSDTLRRMLERERESCETLGQWQAARRLSEAYHQTAQPLATASALAETLQRRGTDGADADTLAEVVAQLRRAATVLREHRDAAEPAAAHPQGCRASDVLEAACERLALEARHYGAGLSVDPSSHEDAVAVPETALRTLLLELTRAGLASLGEATLAGARLRLGIDPGAEPDVTVRMSIDPPPPGDEGGPVPDPLQRVARRLGASIRLRPEGRRDIVFELTLPARP